MFFYCKMCGGELEVNQEATVGQCQYCGTKQTIPKTDNDKIMNLFNRANHYRMKNDFDKAMNLYENIINENSKNAEAYWGLCLCRYGIEYVKDPLTEKMIPTCHRTQLESILEDEDFISACEDADSVARATYEQEAKHIDKIQKKILQISSKEEDYDVFICYKEADEMGERTQDSVIGQDIYDVLTAKGMRVFFARISLEEKVGTAYEPYIFAALQSATIMITIGTKPEYMEAVWVKNEWSRFLAMMKKDSKKTIIPVYKFMNPYEMPECFARIQAVNMEKIGSMQDLVYGIEKILKKDKEKGVEKAVHAEEKIDSVSKYVPLLERAWIFLEDSNWNKVHEYTERILDMNPKCGEAYLIKMLAKLKFNNRKALEKYTQQLDGYDEYRKIMKYGDDKLIKELEQYNKNIIERKRKKAQELYERRKREEKQLHAKKQAIYQKYEKDLKEKQEKVQELKSIVQQNAEEIRQLREKKYGISLKREEKGKEYNEAMQTRWKEENKLEGKKTKQDNIDRVIFWTALIGGAVIGLVVSIIIVCSLPLKGGSGAGLVFGCIIVCVIVGAIVSCSLGNKLMRLVEYIIFHGGYSEEKKKLEQKYYPITEEYQNCCKEEDNIEKEIVELDKKARQYKNELSKTMQELESLWSSLKDEAKTLG